uniref:uncharacterized protein n=1 Tax=Pristiophorus japonicus TaxID=55135 RepID=UPI00398F6736
MSPPKRCRSGGPRHRPRRVGPVADQYFRRGLPPADDGPPPRTSGGPRRRGLRAEPAPRRCRTSRHGREEAIDDEVHAEANRWGGPPVTSNITEMEERVLALMGKHPWTAIQASADPEVMRRGQLCLNRRQFWSSGRIPPNFFKGHHRLARSCVDLHGDWDPVDVHFHHPRRTSGGMSIMADVVNGSFTSGTFSFKIIIISLD